MSNENGKTALCLSGGGFRAMLFHVGALRRMLELGILPNLARISSVSGGSITAGVLALAWPRIRFGAAEAGSDFDTLVRDRLFDFAGKTIDWKAIVWGLIGQDAALNVADHYAAHLFGQATLQDLPDEAASAPRFTINATNLETGNLFRFARKYTADYALGQWHAAPIPLANAVAASSAFPPVLCPLRLKVPANSFPGIAEERTIELGDGGIYDNLGLEPVLEKEAIAAWREQRFSRLLVSDGGQAMADDEEVSSKWGRQLVRVLTVTDNQVRSLRKRQLFAFEKGGVLKFSYWGMRTRLDDLQVPVVIKPSTDATDALASVSTRLAAMDVTTRKRLVNWGYVIADASIRKFHLTADPGPASALPYPDQAW
jgi:NTE family protein